MHYNAIWCNAIRCNAIRYSTMQYDAMQYDTAQCNMMQCNTIQHNAIEYDITQCNKINCCAVCLRSMLLLNTGHRAPQCLHLTTKRIVMIQSGTILSYHLIFYPTLVDLILALPLYFHFNIPSCCHLFMQ